MKHKTSISGCPPRQGGGWRSRLAFTAAMLLASAPAALAQGAPAQQDESFLKTLFKMTGLATDSAPAKDFVAKTRPDLSQTEYVPLYERPKDRPVKVLSVNEVAAKKSSLDNLRAQQERAAGHVPSPFDRKSAAPAVRQATRKPKG